MSLESGHLCRNPVSPDSEDRIPAIWLESGKNGRIPADWPERPDFGLLAGFRRFWQIRASMPESGRSVLESGSFGRNPANPNFDKIVRILAIVAGMAESGKSGRNPVGQ
jgi:hypothetical protein